MAPTQVSPTARPDSAGGVDKSKYKLVRSSGAAAATDMDILVSGRSSDTKNAIAKALEKLYKGNMEEIRIRGLGRACAAVVEVAEVVRWSNPTLYKSVKVGVTDQSREYALKEDAAVTEPETSTVSLNRKVSFLEVTLSVKPVKVEGAQGYCEPCGKKEGDANSLAYWNEQQQNQQSDESPQK